jgi:hypothetical protein
VTPRQKVRHLLLKFPAVRVELGQLGAVLSSSFTETETIVHPYHCPMCDWWHDVPNPSKVCDDCESQIEKGEDVGSENLLTYREISEIIERRRNASDI